MPSTVADRGRALLALAGVACLLGLAACSSNPPAGHPGWTPHDTGDLIVIAEREPGRALLYGVERNARIHYGGGKAAMVGEYTWSGNMSEDEFDALNDALEAHDWFAENPESAGEPKSHYYRVTVYRPSGAMRRFSVHGACPALDEVLEICSRTSKLRLEPFMQTLPKPGAQD